MVRSEKFLAAAVLTGMTLAVVASAAAPFNAKARAASGTTRADIAAERIGGAFASLQQTNIDPAVATTATRPSKGDLAIPSDCADATWPNVDRSCLSKADGSPAPYVRTITIGYQTGPNTTVLLRIPAAVAERATSESKRRYAAASASVRALWASSLPVRQAATHQGSALGGTDIWPAAPL